MEAKAHKRAAAAPQPPASRMGGRLRAVGWSRVALWAAGWIRAVASCGRVESGSFVGSRVDSWGACGRICRGACGWWVRLAPLGCSWSRGRVL